MDTLRMHIVVPKDLVTQIDELAGERGRSAFVVEKMTAAVKRERLLNFLEDMEKSPAWKDEDHPELAKAGTAAYVHNMRHQKSDRQRRIEKVHKAKP